VKKKEKEKEKEEKKERLLSQTTQNKKNNV